MQQSQLFYKIRKNLIFRNNSPKTLLPCISKTFARNKQLLRNRKKNANILMITMDSISLGMSWYFLNRGLWNRILVGIEIFFICGNDSFNIFTLEINDTSVHPNRKSCFSSVDNAIGTIFAWFFHFYTMLVNYKRCQLCRR